MTAALLILGFLFIDDCLNITGILFPISMRKNYTLIYFTIYHEIEISTH